MPLEARVDVLGVAVRAARVEPGSHHLIDGSYVPGAALSEPEARSRAIGSVRGDPMVGSLDEAVVDALRNERPVRVEVGREGAVRKVDETTVYGDRPVRLEDLQSAGQKRKTFDGRRTSAVELRRYRTVLGIWLDLILEDVGPVVVFDEPIIRLAKPVDERREALSVAGSLLSLDVDEPQDVERFFERFGSPIELGFSTHHHIEMAWGRQDRHWISIRRLRQVQAGLQAAAKGEEALDRAWHSGRYDRPAGPVPVGRIRAGEDGQPVWEVDLWAAANVTLAWAKRDGRIGFCVAPAARSSAPCGKPFIIRRVDRGRFCSDRCRSRARLHRDEEGRQ